MALFKPGLRAGKLEHMRQEAGAWKNRHIGIKWKNTVIALYKS